MRRNCSVRIICFISMRESLLEDPSRDSGSLQHLLSHLMLCRSFCKGCSFHHSASLIVNLSPSIQSSLLLPIQHLLSHFPYPYLFAVKPSSRNSTQFIIPSIPAKLPPDASTAFLTSWKVSVDAFIDSTFHTQTDLNQVCQPYGLNTSVFSQP